MAKTNTQSCEAWLVIDHQLCEGKTGKDKGHAEMTALDELISTSGATVKLAIAGAKAKLDKASTKTVYCPSKKCCIKCSYVLKKMGFTPGADSGWSEEKMEPVAWGVSNNVQALFVVMGIDYATVTALA